MGNYLFITGIGLLAQLAFSGRILYQWIQSERAHQVVSPALFWILSVAGSYLLFIYGWMRHDFSIIFGQLISYYIYLWNLGIKGIWKQIPLLMRSILCLTPILAIGMVCSDLPNFTASFLHNEEVPLALLLFGTAGQVIFTCRFIYQWIYSKRRGESILPKGFWIISLIGSSIIISYGLMRLDIVLILGQSVGFIAYIRNLFLTRSSVS